MSIKHIEVSSTAFIQILCHIKQICACILYIGKEKEYMYIINTWMFYITADRNITKGPFAFFPSMKWQLQILSLPFTSLSARLKCQVTIQYNKIKVVTRNSDFWIIKRIQTVYIPASSWWLLIQSASTKICGQLLKLLYFFNDE